jgi:hypothetical protein
MMNTASYKRSKMTTSLSSLADTITKCDLLATWLASIGSDCPPMGGHCEYGPCCLQLAMRLKYQRFGELWVTG